MPDEEQTEPAADDEDATPDASNGRIFSAYGIASAALGALSVAAMALTAIIWSAHRGDVDERAYLSRVLHTAAEWTGVLINMRADDVEAGMQRLRDGTVGELNVDFDAAMQPYRQVVQRLQSRSTGEVEAVAIESVHHEPDTQPGRHAPADQLPAAVASRTDTVMVVATSVAENVGGKPQTVRWNLRLDVSDVDGKLLISRLGSIK